MELGAMDFSSAAISAGLEMYNFEPFGTPAKSFNSTTSGLLGFLVARGGID